MGNPLLDIPLWFHLPDFTHQSSTSPMSNNGVTCLPSPLPIHPPSFLVSCPSLPIISRRSPHRDVSAHIWLVFPNTTPILPPSIIRCYHPSIHSNYTLHFLLIDLSVTLGKDLFAVLDNPTCTSPIFTIDTVSPTPSNPRPITPAKPLPSNPTILELSDSHLLCLGQLNNCITHCSL